jgi:hypothetical protein
MNLKELIRKCIIETQEERITESGESALPLFVLSGGVNQDVKEVHIASEDTIKELFFTQFAELTRKACIFNFEHNQKHGESIAYYAA